MTKGLTPKQEAFAQKDIELTNGYLAYKEVYDAENMSRESIDVEVSKLRGHPKISLRQDEIRSDLAERCAVTIDSISKELDGAIKKADSLDQPSPMVTGILGKAKLHGFMVDHSKITGNTTVTVKTVSFKDE